ncbi:hypothetical protein QVH35_11020 [Candidatus Nitrosotenuis chungbukensis]|uniref:hypothetical protein n=1 Tax=Candidatus Nitrosotenuis TaxID=1825023 RepID=UPI0005B28A38|nr:MULTISPECIES: hypothetical protein [Nitrosotenuis]QLH09205.1 hypothetical protein DSQ19_06755 [Candidatus Nitrosotenuis sp. DW1]WKT57814.1 hypothetical protein QVH35_11020 [Candidatus Nitrosotenuis chungbukensis]
MSHITEDDRRRVELLDLVAKKGLKVLELEDLKQLLTLVENKDYTHNKKAQKSKVKLIAKLDAAIFDIEERKKFN